MPAPRTSRGSRRVGVVVGYRILGEAAMATHFAFIVYGIFGGFLAWRWRRAIWPHSVAVGWGLATLLITLPCPLTDVEDWARRQAGQTGLPHGFVNQYLKGVIYPEAYSIVLESAAAAIIAATWYGARRRWRKQSESIAYHSVKLG